MSDAPDPADEPQVFYSSKPRLIHMAVNIAIAPVLLYLLGAWPWPPVLPHYIVFTITTLMALRFTRKRWSAPRLVVDASGLSCGKFYAADDIYRAEPSMRAVSLKLLEDGKIKTRVISLGWASREDCQAIQHLLAQRFQRELPQDASS